MRSRRVDVALRLLLTRSAMVVALIAALNLGETGANAADPSPSPSGERSIAVSVPPDPVPLEPGEVGVVQLRVVNPGTTPVRVRVTGRGLTLGDEGEVTINDGPDLLWGDAVRFPSGAFTIPAQGFKDLAVNVHAPSSLQPDLYFLGFVVTPISNPTTGVTVINQIGGFFTIDIPGPRDRRLAADLKLPGWSILGLQLFVGSDLNGTLHVHNIGQAAVRFWGETDTTTTGGSPSQMRIPISLVPSLRERTFVVASKPAWPIGFVHMQVRIVYPTTTETATTEILFTRSVLVIDPLVFVVLAILVLVVIWRRLRAGRRRRAARRQPTKPRSRSLSSGPRRRPAHARQSLFRSTFSGLRRRREA
jgi:hypothetical protein